MIKAPFTEEQVLELNKYQEEGKMHPFTCPQDGDMQHIVYEFNKLKSEMDWNTYITTEKERGVPHPEMAFNQTNLIATKEGWICPACDYKQDWAHEFMTIKKETA